METCGVTIAFPFHQIPVYYTTYYRKDVDCNVSITIQYRPITVRLLADCRPITIHYHLTIDYCILPAIAVYYNRLVPSSTVYYSTTVLYFPITVRLLSINVTIYYCLIPSITV